MPMKLCLGWSAAACGDERLDPIGRALQIQTMTSSDENGNVEMNRQTDSHLCHCLTQRQL